MHCGLVTMPHSAHNGFRRDAIVVAMAVAKRDEMDLGSMLVDEFVQCRAEPVGPGPDETPVIDDVPGGQPVTYAHRDPGRSLVGENGVRRRQKNRWVGGHYGITLHAYFQ